MDHADKTPGQSIAPSSLFESVLILTAKDQAKADEVELGNDIGIEKKQFLDMLEKMQTGEESDRLIDYRAVLEPGGFAEATLRAGGANTKTKGKAYQSKGVGLKTITQTA